MFEIQKYTSSIAVPISVGEYVTGSATTKGTMDGGIIGDATDWIRCTRQKVANKHVNDGCCHHHRTALSSRENSNGQAFLSCNTVG